MHQMIELHPRPDALLGLGLPAIPYPVALPTFQAAVANDGELPLADMLHGLQLRAAIPDGKWQALAPAMGRLAELLADSEPADGDTTAVDGGVLELGAVGPQDPVVALSREGVLLAAMTSGPAGRLRVSTWQPLDARTADLLMVLGAAPVAGDGRPGADAWTRASAAARADQDAALHPVAGAEETGVRFSWHPDGLDGAGFTLTDARPAAHVAAELRVRRTFAPPGAAPVESAGPQAPL